MSRYSDLILGEPGIEGYWRLGDSTSTIADSKGTNTGTAVNAPTLGVAGALPDDANASITFTAGSSHHITLVNAPTSLGNGPYSMEAWFKTSATGANFCAFNLENLNGAGGSIGWALGNLGNGRVTAIDGANRIISSATTPLYNDNKWHHLVITKIVAGDVWKMYVDGNDVTTADALPNTTTSSSATTNSRIGCQYNGGTQRWFFTGTLDEVAYYSVALSQAQAYTHFTTGLQSNYGYIPTATPRSRARRTRLRQRFADRWSGGDAAAAAQNLFLTTTDAVTTADVATRTGAFLRSATDAVTTADTVTRTAILLRTSTDAVTTADVVTRILSAFRTTTDAVSATQAATRTGTFLRSATDTLTSSDAATRIGAFLRTTTDAVTLSDVATDVKTKNATAADAVTTADTATRIGAFLRTGTDAVTTSDSALRTELDSRQGTDAVTTSESVTRLLAALRTSTDAVTVSETLSRLLVALRSTSDAVTASQVASRILAALRSTSDAVSTSDAATRLVTAARSVTDAVTTADTATRTEVLLRTATDALTLSDSVTATQNARSTTDTVTTSDTATVAQVLFRSAADSVTISDTATVSGGQASSGGGAVANPGYGKRVLREMTRQPDKKPSIERIRRETVLVATSDRLTIRDASVAVVEFTQDEADLEVLLGL